MLDGDGAAPTAAPGLAGKGECPSFNGRLLSGLCDVGFVHTEGRVSNFSEKSHPLPLCGGTKDSPSCSAMAEASSGAAGESSLLAFPVIPPCPCPVQAGWAEGRWLPQGCQELWFPMAQLTEELEQWQNWIRVGKG